MNCGQFVQATSINCTSGRIGSGVTVRAPEPFRANLAQRSRIPRVRVYLGLLRNTNQSADVVAASGKKQVRPVDAGYQGVGKSSEIVDKTINWHTAMRPSVHKALKKPRWAVPRKSWSK